MKGMIQACPKRMVLRDISGIIAGICHHSACSEKSTKWPAYCGEKSFKIPCIAIFAPI